MKCQFCEEEAESQCPDCGVWTCWEHRRDFPPNFDDHLCAPCVEKRNAAITAQWREMHARGEPLNELQLRWIGGAHETTDVLPKGTELTPGHTLAFDLPIRIVQE